MKSIIALIQQNRALSLAFLAVFLFCVGIYLYTRWDTARFEASLSTPPPVQEPPPETHSTEPQAPQSGQAGHFHPDGTYHAEPHAPGEPPATAPGRDTVPPDSEAPPPPLTREELPDVLPYPMTQENRHIWDTLATQAVEDEVLLQKLLPDTKEKAFETLTHLHNSVNDLDLASIFKAAMWRKMVSLYPNDPEVLFMYTRYMPRGPRATRAEKQAFVAHWERLKRLNDEHGIPLTSELRKTHGLSQAYVDLGEYEKAIQNIHGQNDWKAALRRAGIYYQRINHGLLPRGTVIELQKLLDAQRQQREQQRNAQDR